VSFPQTRLRRLRRATLRNARNLALSAISSRLIEVRFKLMLNDLQIAGERAAVQEPARCSGEGFSEARRKQGTDPEEWSEADGAGDPPPGIDCRDGLQPARRAGAQTS